MTRQTFYDWYVEFRHPVQGFAKRYSVGAYKYEQAIRDAKAELVKAGYRPEDFDVVEVRRGKFL